MALDNTTLEQIREAQGHAISTYVLAIDDLNKRNDWQAKTIIDQRAELDKLALSLETAEKALKLQHENNDKLRTAESCVGHFRVENAKLRTSNEKLREDNAHLLSEYQRQVVFNKNQADMLVNLSGGKPIETTIGCGCVVEASLARDSSGWFTGLRQTLKACWWHTAMPGENIKITTNPPYVKPGLWWIVNGVTIQ
jgi:hypothetical protein